MDALDVDDPTACPTNQVVMVVADLVLEAGRRLGGLDPTKQALVSEHAERVVDGLT